MRVKNEYNNCMYMFFVIHPIPLINTTPEIPHFIGTIIPHSIGDFHGCDTMVFYRNIIETMVFYRRIPHSIGTIPWVLGHWSSHWDMVSFESLCWTQACKGAAALKVTFVNMRNGRVE
jgi:hypothetical protein